MVVIAVRGKDNYWRHTIYLWLLEVKNILEYELHEPVEIIVLEGDSEDPELIVNNVLVGKGVPGEEGYLIEILKKAILRLRNTRETL